MVCSVWLHLAWLLLLAADTAGSFYVDLEDLQARNYNGQEGMWCRGINVVGFDLAPQMRRSGGWSVPEEEMLRYLHDQGSNCFRLPITWERLQRFRGMETLDLVAGYEETVEFITATLGDYVIIDPHNNDEGLRHNGEDATKTDFVRLWKALAERWRGNDRVIFGLYNEPRYGFEDARGAYFDPDSLDRSGAMIEKWRQWMQATIDEIRNLGATNLILVPGLHWTSCADWAGGEWWGETIGDTEYAGNTRLASLTDPAANLVYDVHQYFDLTLGGVEPGCLGHDTKLWCQPDCPGADVGLERTIAWAQRYNKKFMMTEIGSYRGDNERICESKLRSFIGRMQESGVFIGYQVWQAGCAECLGDHWSTRSSTSNLDWYRLDDDALRVCSASPDDCRPFGCCVDPLASCYEKNEHFATCRRSCVPGMLDEADSQEVRTPWNCKLIVNRTEMTMTSSTTTTSTTTTATRTTTSTTRSTTSSTLTERFARSVRFILIFQGITYHDRPAEFWELWNAFSVAVKNEVASHIGNGIRATDVVLLLSKGSVRVDVEIRVPVGFDLIAVQETAGSASFVSSLTSSVVSAVSRLDGIQHARAGSGDIVASVCQSDTECEIPNTEYDWLGAASPCCSYSPVLVASALWALLLS